MPFERKRSELVLSAVERAQLEELTRSRTVPHGRAVRARMLLGYADGAAINALARIVGVSRPTVERCVDKALSGGCALALQDLPRSGRPPSITAEDKAWVVDLACQQPSALGYPHAVWTYSLLRDHIQGHAAAAGYPALARVTRGMVHAMLTEAEIQPHRIRYYLERRDPEFEAKMAQVLTVYKEVAIANERGPGTDPERPWVVISYDEKPGIQAVANVAPELPPVPGQHPSLSRDYEYHRHGTVSLLAGIDLHDGHVTGLVRDRHRSREFIEFLGLLHARYPASTRLRLILDSHSAHISKETVRWLKAYPNRFEFVFTPKHGSWLNLVEVFFSKMSRALLRHLRAGSKQELKKRIEQYLDLVNEDPVVFRWTYRLDEVQV